MVSKKVLVIGAGASGLLAAGFLAQRGAKVTVLEKMMRTASKVRISGKGRCNITNALPIQDFPDYYPCNGRFLHGALSRFTNEDCLTFFASLGIDLKTERGQRVFPVSDDAHEVANALENFAISQGVKIRLGHKAIKIEIDDDGQLKGIVCLHQNQTSFYPASTVVVATGGSSYPGTGSSGDGYGFARQLGHEVVEPRPALVPICLQEKWARQLSGLSLRNVQLRIGFPKSQVYFGELMFTHFGLTGPIVLTASEQIWLLLKERGRPLRAFIDLKPALGAEQLDLRLLRDLKKLARKHFSNFLEELVPKGLIPILVDLLSIPPDKPCHQITKAERTQLGGLLKNLPLTITRTLPLSAAIVTAGGVQVKEIDPRTMQSKKKDGVYFVGEVLDFHGVTGGFNLQAAFSTGFCAAQAVEL